MARCIGTGSRANPSVDRSPCAQLNGAGVIVCPGGGYRTLASDHEGLQVAQWLNQSGIHAFVLRYRLGPEHHSSVSLRDGKRAVRMVRHRSSEWGVDPTRLGMLGFSAGGHLALATALSADAREEPLDAIDDEDSRPNFLVPLYAVTNGDARGRKADEYWPTDILVDDKTPPTFIMHTHEDSVVPASQATCSITHSLQPVCLQNCTFLTMEIMA